MPTDVNKALKSKCFYMAYWKLTSSILKLSFFSNQAKVKTKNFVS